jgi:hypothetical protein
VAVVLGIGLGNYFVAELGFKWIVIKDGLGRDLSVKHFDSNLISFPISSVRKRIGTSESGFFKAIVEMFKHEIENKNLG